MNKLTGSCLCGQVTFDIDDNFHNFQLCFCTQCQKTTGSAHASNLFTNPQSINWKSGVAAIVRFDLEDRRISNAFCSKCGSRVPYLSKSGEVLAVPAGSLNGRPSILPVANIFWPERPDWYDAAVQAQHYQAFIE